MLILILSCLSAYGLICIIIQLYNCLMHKKIPCKYIIVSAKNQTDSIEGMLRCLMHEHPDTEIIVVDNDSTEETLEILNKICTDFSCVHTAKTEFDFFK